MTEYLKRVSNKDDADYQFHSGLAGYSICNSTDIPITGKAGLLEEIQRPKIVNLSGLVGSTEILFEFWDDGCVWKEGYLLDINYTREAFNRAVKLNDQLLHTGLCDRIRFQTDRWYHHDGMSPCPLPEGVDFEVECVYTYIRQFSTIIHNNARGHGSWTHNDTLRPIIAYRIKGLLPGWSYGYE